MVGRPPAINATWAPFAGRVREKNEEEEEGNKSPNLIPIPSPYPYPPYHPHPNPTALFHYISRRESPQGPFDTRKDSLEQEDEGAGDAGTDVGGGLDARDEVVVPVEDGEQVGGVAVGVLDGAQGGLFDDEFFPVVLLDRQGHDGAVVGLESDLGAVDDAAGKVEARRALVQPLVGLELGEPLGESRVEEVVARVVAVEEDLVVALLAPLAGAVDVPELLHDGLGHGLLDPNPRLRVGRPRQIRHVASDALDALGLDQAPAFASQQRRDVGQVRAREQQGAVVEGPPLGELERAAADLEPLERVVGGSHDNVVAVVDSQLAEPVSRSQRRQGTHHHLGLRAAFERLCVGHDDRVVQVPMVVEHRAAAAPASDQIDRDPGCGGIVTPDSSLERLVLFGLQSVIQPLDVRLEPRILIPSYHDAWSVRVKQEDARGRVRIGEDVVLDGEVVVRIVRGEVENQR